MHFLDAPCDSPQRKHYRIVYAYKFFCRISLRSDVVCMGPTTARVSHASSKEKDLLRDWPPQVELDFGLVDSKAPARVRVSSPTCERGGAWIVAFRSQFRVISRSQKGSLTHQSIQIVDLAKVVMVECSDGSNRGSVNVMSVRPV